MFQEYITIKFRLVRTETSPVKSITWGQETKMGTFSIVNMNYMYFQNIRQIFDSTWNSVSNIYCISLVRQTALNDEIDAFIGYFKLRLDLKKLNKYLTYCFDGPIFLGMKSYSGHLHYVSKLYVSKLYA